MRNKNRGTNRNLSVTLLLVLLAAFSNCQGMQKASSPDDVLVFEGTIEKLGPDQGILSGRIAVYRLAKYRIQRMCAGKYDEKEIVVDHLVISGKEFKDLKIGDRVCVRVKIADKVLARYDADGIRSSSDVVKTFYVAVEAVRRSHQVSNCCDTPR